MRANFAESAFLSLILNSIVTALSPLLNNATTGNQHPTAPGSKAPSHTGIADSEWTPEDFRPKDYDSVRGPVLPIASNFPDPSYIEVFGTQYAFATNDRDQSPTVRIQVANSLDKGKSWKILMDGGVQRDALPHAGNWSSGNQIWAPDVVQLNDTSFVMYYAAEVKAASSWHCIGAATASIIIGPYTPQPSPLFCPIGKELGGDTEQNEGGAIDADGFLDKNTNKRYVVYKIDGNILGHGGSCSNWPLNGENVMSTPIMIQEVDASDGITKIGKPKQILDRDDRDGPLIEAPSLYEAGGIYFLFFSSNCYTGSLYSASYATSTSLFGPYTRSNRTFFMTGDGPNLLGPGGVDISTDGKTLVFHGNMRNELENERNTSWKGNVNMRQPHEKPRAGFDKHVKYLKHDSLGKPSDSLGSRGNDLVRNMYVAKPIWDGLVVRA